MFPGVCSWYRSKICRSCISQSVWPNDLQHVSSVALRTAMIFTKFEVAQPTGIPFRSWLNNVLLLIGLRCVTMWPWPLTLWRSDVNKATTPIGQGHIPEGQEHNHVSTAFMSDNINVLRSNLQSSVFTRTQSVFHQYRHKTQLNN